MQKSLRMSERLMQRSSLNFVFRVKLHIDFCLVTFISGCGYGVLSVFLHCLNCLHLSRPVSGLHGPSVLIYTSCLNFKQSKSKTVYIIQELDSNLNQVEFIWTTASLLYLHCLLPSRMWSVVGLDLMLQSTCLGSGNYVDLRVFKLRSARENRNASMFIFC